MKVQNGGYHFTLSYTDPKTGQREEVKDCTLFRPGEHHLLNALAAVAVAHQAGYPLADLTRALASFKGVKRRFSYIINTPEQVFIDDYAHHPTELNALYNGVRTMYPHKEITILFQPHLFTRTRDFADGFAKSLSQFDRVVLLDIYPARELPIEGVTSQWLLDKIENPNKVLLSKSEIINYLQAQPARVLVLAGAGDIGVEERRSKSFGKRRIKICTAKKKYVLLRPKTGRYSSGQRGQTVNLLVFTFTGSNPVLPRVYFIRFFLRE